MRERDGSAHTHTHTHAHTHTHTHTHSHTHTHRLTDWGLGEQVMPNNAIRFMVFDFLAGPNPRL